MTETEFRIKTKLIGYRSERSSEKLQINLVFYPDKKIKIALCFCLKITNFIVKKERLLKIC